MSARRVIIARRALSDLDGIWSYVAAEATRETASRLIARILDAMERLSEMPGMGHTRLDLPRHYRAWRVFRFLIIYRFDQSALYVARVIHGHRDVRRVFGTGRR
jgi:plasmid stabilization system protein ParE